MNKALGIQIGLAVTGAVAAILLSLATRNALLPETPKAAPQMKPDFTSYTDVNAKKQAFFDYVLPGVRNANDEVLKQRQQVLAWQQALAEGELSSRQRRRLETMAEYYEINPDLETAEKLELLLRRVDIVPASLALAQAAKESGWGTSRFSRLGNNYFGQWCFSEGCGLVPSQRSAGAVHEVQVFETVEDAVGAYIHNLNTHPPYRELREIRAELRDQGHISGEQVAQGLSRYSERGPVYIGEIQSLIRFNDLAELDRPIENSGTR